MDFDDFLTRARAALIPAARGDGYARYSSGGASDLYGTAAAVGILLALGERPSGTEAQRVAASMRTFEAADGTFSDPTHGVHHRAATALATLAALGEATTVPAGLAALFDADAVPAFLDGLDWSDPWLASHDAAGVLAIGVVTVASEEAARARWLSAYTSWLDDHADADTGLWLGGRMGDVQDDPGLFGNLACSFHLHFLYERLGRAWPNPAGVVDTGLVLYTDTDAVIGRGADDWGFRQLDWAYSVGRAARSGHRRADVDRAMTDLATRAARAFALAEASDVDLHVLQARVGLVAELSQRLPGLIGTGGRTLTSIVDVRPFI